MDAEGSRLITAYSNNGYLDYWEPLEVEFTPPCPFSEWSFGWESEGLPCTPADASGYAKIRGGYDYRELYRSPTSMAPHSICPGDLFISLEGPER